VGTAGNGFPKTWVIAQRSVAALGPDTERDRVYYDDRAAGFGVRVTKAGVKSFILNYRCGGRERRLTIGRWPEWSAEAARDKAKALRVDIDNGIDPQAEKDAEREAPTMKELADDYIEQHAIPHKKPSSVKQDRRMIQTHVIPALGDKLVSAVGKRDIEKLHTSLRATPYEANRVRSLLSKMFALAVGWEFCEKNPCKGIKKFDEPKHDFWLSEEQLHKLELALNEYPDQNAADAIRLLIRTGSREGEVLNADWSQFDLGRETWTKPSHATKEKKTENIPLSEPALEILRRMEKSKTSRYLFPRSDDPARPRPSVRDCCRVSCVKAGLATPVHGKRRWKPTVRINDLRHTFASHLVSRNWSLQLVGKLLGHTQAATTQRYAHVADAALRNVTNDFSKVLEMPKRTA
jgi:integrase